MNPRGEFLLTLFAELKANNVPYCVLRNYDKLFDDTETDVDLIVAGHSLASFRHCLGQAAERNSFRLVQATRHVSYSQVYWHPQAGFVRMDFQTDLRWRVFPMLPAHAILNERQPHNGFFIPHPHHESVILWVAAVWRGFLSDGYRERLARLHAACADTARLRRTLREAFGAAGDALADLQSRLPAGEFDHAFCARLRRSLVGNALRDVRRFAALVQNTVSDAGRLVGRVRRAAGVSLLFVSANRRLPDFDDLRQRLDLLFPAKRSLIETFDVSGKPTAHTGCGLRWRLRRLRVLFKGGLFVSACRAETDASLPSLVRARSRHLYPSRTFVGLEDSAGRLCFGHVQTGFMAASGLSEPSGKVEFSSLFSEFLANVLKRSAATGAESPRDCRTRGVFCVLVGLDGSGKTTLARQLCSLAMNDRRLGGVRYFHWRPKTLKSVEFPLPEFQNLPRKHAPAKNILNSVLSVTRLLKNAALAHLACGLRVRPLLRRGSLVLVDRFFFNYHLDPVSVKYSGPPWLLAVAQKIFPRPDVVVVLRAPTGMLLERKQELSGAEILRQAAVLDNLKFEAARVIVVDASRPAEEVARNALAQILKTAP